MFAPFATSSTATPKVLHARPPLVAVIPSTRSLKQTSLRDTHAFVGLEIQSEAGVVLLHNLPRRLLDGFRANATHFGYTIVGRESRHPQIRVYERIRANSV